MKIKLLGSIVVVLLCCCARQVGPGGGPDDVMPPQVKKTLPPVGSAGVGVTDKIVLTFSEWLDKKTVKDAVAIFPEPLQGIRVRASGHTITITPVVSFADSTTYHIEIGRALKDLHNNTVAVPYQYYFSTGKTIDSGSISGCIVSPLGTLFKQAKAALFAVGWNGLPDSAYCSVPDYVIQTDTVGGFSFNHIHKGRYALVGFIDNNNDNRIQPGTESVFGSLDRTILVDPRIGPIPLYASVYDTTGNTIVAIKHQSSHYLAGYWLHGRDSVITTELGMWRLERGDSTAAALKISRYIPIADGRRFMLFLSDTMSAGDYRFMYPHRMRSTTDTGPVRYDTLRFSVGSTTVDTLPPLAAGMFPQGQSDLTPIIKIVWTRPVVCRMLPWQLGDSLGDTVQLTAEQTFSDTTVLTPQSKLKPSRHYRLAIAGSRVEDITGRHPADKYYDITTINSEDMCNSLSGSMPCLPPDPSRTWLFVPLHSDSRYVSKVKGVAFYFDSLPAGKGTVAYFSDYNGDGKPTPGSLVPWKKPEVYRAIADTIEARARWDIEGIVPKASCKECGDTTSDTKQPAAVESSEGITPAVPGSAKH